MNELDYNITLFEACEILNRSKKTLSRYIRRGKINPLKVKSLQGTLEYRFSKADIDTLRAELARVDTQDRADRTHQTEETGQRGHARQDTIPLEKANLSTKGSGTALKQEQTGQERQDRGDRPDRTEETRETGQDLSVIAILKETTELLKSQLTVKDTQIETLNGQVQQLIERDRETNILLMRLQDKILLLEPPKFKDITEQTGRDKTKQKRLIILFILLLITAGAYFYTTNTNDLIEGVKEIWETIKTKLYS